MAGLNRLWRPLNVLRARFPRYENRAWPLLASFLAILLFYFVNRPAWRGYFSEDDLATLMWAPYVSLRDYFGMLISPAFSALNVRPVGLLYYHFLDLGFHLHYGAYVLFSQAFHILNVVLLLLLLRRLDFSGMAAGAGALFYAFSAAVMQAYWKPMYVFDLLCATLCLLTLLLYLRNRWLLAVIPFWLAYKTKEIALLLPVAILAYELLLGKKKWKRLIPYFPITLSFGLQAVWHNRAVPHEHSYSLHFTSGAVMEAVRFYSSVLFFQPDLWVALLLLPFIIRDRRLTLGVVFTAVILAPLLLLSLGQQHAVYCYAPIIGVAIVLSAIASKTPSWAVALFFAVWLPIQIIPLRAQRREILAEGDRTRALVTSLQKYAGQAPPLRAIVYENIPEHLKPWGVDGAIAQAFGPHLRAARAGTPAADEAMTQVPMALISFDASTCAVKGLIRTRDGNQSYARFFNRVQESQFGPGWYDDGQGTRWIAPRAEATLYRPDAATQFEIVAFLPREAIEKDGPSEVTVFEDGQSLGTVTLSRPVLRPLRWKLTAGQRGDKRITILSEPVRHGGPQDPRDLGIVVSSIGYLPLN